jgi:hypothetical protein
VNYTYTYIDESGNEQSKTITKYSTTLLTVLSLTLTTSINIANTGITGMATIPYTVKGNGSKSVFLYRNGKLVDQHEGITSSSSSNSFSVALVGNVDNFQIVA